MLSKTKSRSAIAVLLAMLFVGFTVAQPAHSADDQSVASQSIAIADDWADDSTSPLDFLHLPHAAVSGSLTRVIILVDSHPRPATGSFVVNYPEWPQGPPR